MTITLAIVILTGLISFSAFSNEKLLNDLIFYPPAISQRKQWYRFVTCGFIHADFTHLIFNMISLYLFGQFVEDGFRAIFQEKGKLLFLVMYVLALPACILPTYFRNIHNYHYRSLGASGAVSAVVFAGLIIAPTIEVGFFFIPPIIPGFVFGPAYLIISAILDRKGGSAINHSAHIWGAVFGMVFIVIAGKWVADYDVLSECLYNIRNYLAAKGI